MSPRVLVLALGTFAVGTGTFVVTGILGSVSGDLSVPVGAAGYLVTVFAAAYAVGSPLLVAATARGGGVRVRQRPVYLPPQPEERRGVPG